MISCGITFDDPVCVPFSHLEEENAFYMRKDTERRLLFCVTMFIVTSGSFSVKVTGLKGQVGITWIVLILRFIYLPFISISCFLFFSFYGELMRRGARRCASADIVDPIIRPDSVSTLLDLILSMRNRTSSFCSW